MINEIAPKPQTSKLLYGGTRKRILQLYQTPKLVKRGESAPIIENNHDDYNSLNNLFHNPKQLNFDITIRNCQPMVSRYRNSSLIEKDYTQEA